MSAAANVVSSTGCRGWNIKGWGGRGLKHVLTVKTLHVNGERVESRLSL